MYANDHDQGTASKPNSRSNIEFVRCAVPKSVVSRSLLDLARKHTVKNLRPFLNLHIARKQARLRRLKRRGLTPANKDELRALAAALAPRKP